MSNVLRTRCFLLPSFLLLLLVFCVTVKLLTNCMLNVLKTANTILLPTDPLRCPLLASPSVSLPASVEAQERGSLNITCEGSAFLEVFIEFTVTGVSASHTAGEMMLVSEATGTTSHVARRTITLQALSTLDCGGLITCTVSSVSGGTTYTSNATTTLQVLGG